MRLFRTALVHLSYSASAFFSLRRSLRTVSAPISAGASSAMPRREFGIFRELGLGAVRVSIPWKIC